MTGSTNASERDKVIRPAASLLIVRDGDNGVEVLTLKRSASMRFLPNYLAFPGGTLDGEDWETQATRVSGAVQAQEQPDDAVYAVGGIRECVEEVGWLCAVVSGDARERSEMLHADEQVRMLQNDLRLVDVLAARDAVVDLSAVRFVGRWVTPAYMPARFDTRFFLYVMQTPDLAVQLQSSENAWVQWYTPEQLLHRIQSGVEQAVPPTIAMLQGLSGQPSADACFAHLRVPGPPLE